MKHFISRLMANQLTGVTLVLGVIFILSSFASEYFLTAYNMLIVTRTLAFIALITLGQSMLMILGELDLSVGSIAGLCGIVGGILMVEKGVNPFVAFVLCLICGIILGFVNGILVTTLKLSSLVLTIGMSGVYSGTVLVLTKGLAITGIPETIGFLGKGVYFGIPTPFIIMIVLLVIITVITQKTPFGRYIYAIGNSKQAARMLGIKVDRIRVMCFMIAGFLASLAGMLMVARLGTAQPSIGDVWVLPPIAASVIGGVATTGGVGSPIGAVIGAAIIGIIQSIIVLFGISPYWQSVVSGVIVVFAISFDSISRQYLKKES